MIIIVSLVGFCLVWALITSLLLCILSTGFLVFSFSPSCCLINLSEAPLPSCHCITRTLQGYSHCLETQALPHSILVFIGFLQSPSHPWPALFPLHGNQIMSRVDGKDSCYSFLLTSWQSSFLTL